MLWGRGLQLDITLWDEEQNHSPSYSSGTGGIWQVIGIGGRQQYGEALPKDIPT